MSKSSLTNILSFLIIITGHFSPIYKEQILSIGYFALSGAITNWLAIHMLFEKVPGLYGSGVIPSRFKEFKEGIYSLIMNQFFTQDNIKKFFAEKEEDLFDKLDLSGFLEKLDYKRFFDGVVETIEQSSFAPMLMMVGGTGALEPMRAPFSEKMKSTLHSYIQTDDFKESLKSTNQTNDLKEEIIQKVEVIVKKRLDELTPEMVKMIIQEMIKKHLGWLVVWGGVFGGVIGLIMSLLN